MISFDKLGVRPAEILLPKETMDMQRWAVVACDQYSAQPEYWAQADALVGDAPSTLRMIYPEAYLHEGTARIPGIHQAMTRYLEEGIFAPTWEGFVLVERTTESGTRLGLVLAVDLEAYDHTTGTACPIRATEGTILDRIPPRMHIRRGAPLELPHVLLLANDPERSIIEPLYALRETLRPLYDTPLMLGGGSIRGWAVEQAHQLNAIAQAMAALSCPGGLRFAVGDGNHSLATARACWLELRDTLPPDQRATHPARYALAELCNVYDAGIQFEPIHRVLFGVGPDQTLSALDAWLQNHQSLRSQEATGQSMILIGQDYEQALHIQNPPYTLPVATLQAFLDDWLPQTNATIDYIHGDDVLRKLSAKAGCCGFLLEGMDKQSLFPAIAQDGVLPRKTFSMGEAHEKRYYLECRALSR